MVSVGMLKLLVATPDYSRGQQLGSNRRGRNDDQCVQFYGSENPQAAFRAGRQRSEGIGWQDGTRLVNGPVINFN